jgi:hypothetical protein
MELKPLFAVVFGELYMAGGLEIMRSRKRRQQDPTAQRRRRSSFPASRFSSSLLYTYIYYGVLSSGYKLYNYS